MDHISTSAVRFERCHTVTKAWEGGWSNHSRDPGGKTMYGVTEARWHEYQDMRGVSRTPVRNITMEQAIEFYRTEFWEKCGAPNLHSGVDLATYDASVNSGVSRGRKWLLASLSPADDHVATVKAICAKRLGFVQSLKIWSTFGRGWANRIADVQAKGVSWALQAMERPQPRVRETLEEVAHASEKKATRSKEHAAGAGTGSVLSGTTEVVDVSNQIADWVLIGVGAALLAFAIYLVIRWRINAKFAAAYRREAGAF